jgi:hypothetical protein
MKHKTVEMHHIDEHGRLTHESACMSKSGKPSSTGMHYAGVRNQINGGIKRGFSVYASWVWTKS